MKELNALDDQVNRFIIGKKVKKAGGRQLERG
jgi:hypothetical protein